MIIYDIDGGLKHYVGTEDTFGITTLCGKQLTIDRVLQTNVDTYKDCDCSDCLYEIEKDLKRRPAKKSKNSGKI